MWLWYEGIPIPVEEIRDRVLAYLERIDNELTELREFAKRETPGLERYEYVTAAAERYAEVVMHTNLVAGVLPAFAEEVGRDADGPVIPPKPDDLLQAAWTQLFCHLQGETDAVDDSARRVLDATLTTSGVGAEPDADLPDAHAMLEVMMAGPHSSVHLL